MSDVSTRRVYELSPDLVDRIQRHAIDIGASEVGAVRILLEEALGQRETGAELEARARKILGRAGLPSAVDMLVLHPRVVEITKGAGYVDVRCSDGHGFMLSKGFAVA